MVYAIIATLEISIISTSALFIDAMAILMATVSLSRIFLFFRMATRKSI